MICAHLKHLRTSELKGSDRHKQADYNAPRFLPFLMTLVARIFVFPVLYRFLRTFWPIFEKE